MSGLLQDLRYALRQLHKSPGFTAIAVLTLALGIGATAAIFSVVYGVLLRPLPYADPNRIMAVFEIQPKGGWNRLADPNFDDFRDQSRSFEAIAKYSAYLAAVSGGSQPTRSTVAHVSPEFLKVFRIQPIIGHDFTAADNNKGAAPVALVSYGYWKQYLGSSLDLSQLHLKIDNTVFPVIGVLPEGFQFPQDTALWVPADRKGKNPSRSSHNYDAVARLRDGKTVEQANAEISAMARRIHDASSEQGDFLLKDATVVPLQDSITGQTRPALLVLLGAVGFLLLVACANVANLRLAQASVRERELAIRSALGALRGRLVRQFVIEAFVLSLLGAGLGVLGAYFGMTGLLALAPQNLPRLAEVSINLPVLSFALLLCCGVAIAIGIFTALQATSGDVRKGLGEGGREQAGSQSSHSVGRGIVAAQIAITLVLVIGAGLLGRSLMKVLEVNPGFRVDKIVTMDVSLPWPDWTDWKAKAGQAIFFRNLMDQLRRIPGVRQVGATSGLPMTGGVPNGEFLPMTQNEVPKNPTNLQELSRDFDILFSQKERLGTADFCVATDGYFQALGIPLLRGRIFDERDGPDSSHVAVISASLARERWPGQDPIGRTIEFGNMDGDLRLLTIVGVVGDVHEYGADTPPNPTVYANLFQRPHPDMTLTMLGDADTQQVTSAARKILYELNPEIPPRFRTFSQVYSASLGSRRFNLILLGFFAGIALLLATAGVLGGLAVGEIAFATLLVISAGLLIRSFWALSHINPGFQPEHVVTARITPNESFCNDPARCVSFYDVLLEKIQNTPGVSKAALVNDLPLGGTVTKRSLQLEDYVSPIAGIQPLFWLHAVTPNYFHVMAIPLLSGRGFTPADESGPPVAIVSAKTAQKFWPGQNAIGKHMQFARDNQWRTVVGVLADVRAYDLQRNLPDWLDGAVYVPYSPTASMEDGHIPSDMSIVMQTTLEDSQIDSTLRGIVTALNPEAPVTAVKTMSAVVSEAVSTPASTTSLFVTFAGLALVLGLIGIYGVLAFLVYKRTREIGIRVALGAQPTHVLLLVLKEGAKFTVTGIVLGLVGAFVVTRWLSSELYGVGAVDPLTYGSVAAIMALVTMLACYVPARRAMRVDPLIALRSE